MRPILASNKKKALSNMVAYVLLITITISLSVLVYNWLRFYVSEDEVPICHEGVSVIITNYNCVGEQQLTVDIKNKGRFTVDGFALRVHNRTEANFGFYNLNQTGVSLKPGETHRIIQNISGIDTQPYFATLTLIEVQPFLMEGNKISCKSIATQEISSCN